MVQFFFTNGYLLKQMNHNFISLIPKEDAPDTIRKYCPNSLCNVSYKIIPKVMTAHLKTMMSKQIFHNQNACVPHQHIQDNLILVHEIMHTLQRKLGKGGLLEVKIDMEKAEDKVDWNFLLEVLKCFGFSAKWWQLVH